MMVVMGDLLNASSLVAFRITFKNLVRIISVSTNTPTTTRESQGITIEIRTKTVITLKKNYENQVLITGMAVSITPISLLKRSRIPP